jgi:hypothetical protein
MSAPEIAQWMVDQLDATMWLRQRPLAFQVLGRWGDSYLHKNKNHNWALNADILAEFARLTGDGVVWSRSQQAWRKRQPADGPSRMIR